MHFPASFQLLLWLVRSVSFPHSAQHFLCAHPGQEKEFDEGIFYDDREEYLATAARRR